MSKDLFDDTYWAEKEARTKYYHRFIKGWKLRKCTACNGSGYYDNESAKCQACEPPGSGKERFK